MTNGDQGTSCIDGGTRFIEGWGGLIGDGGTSMIDGGTVI